MENSMTQRQLAFYDWTADRRKRQLPDPPTEDEIRLSLAENNTSSPLSQIVCSPLNKGNLNILRTFAFTAIKRFDRSCRGCNFGIYAGSGQGKTYVVKQWAKTIGIPFVLVQSAGLDDTHQLFQEICAAFETATFEGRKFPKIVEHEKGLYRLPPCIVFFDEAHTLKKKLMTGGLLNAMESEDGQMAVKEPGAKGDIFTVDCRKVCWVGATTERGMLFDAFENRLGTAIEWHPAGPEQVAKIVKMKTDKAFDNNEINYRLPEDVCGLVAKYRRVPREAISFGVKMAQKKDMMDTWPWADVAAQVASDIGLDEYGMTHKQVMILTALGQRPIAQSRIHNIAKCRAEQVERYELPPLMDYSTTEGPLVVPVPGKGLCITEAGLAQLDQRKVEHKGRKITAEYFESKTRTVAKPKLPKINPSRLQRTVADVEFAGDYDDFDALCEAVADHKWSKGLNLDAWTIGALMIRHDTIVTMDKPDAMPESETPPPAPKPPKATKPVETKEIKTYDEGGRGKKQCPSCQKYVGARNAVCACGHEFNKPKPKPAPRSVGAAAAPLIRQPEPEVEQEYTPGRHVFCTVRQRTAIPAPATQPCPHKLESTDIAAVEEWAEKVRISCQREYGQWMMVSALRYYASGFYDVFSEEFETVKAHLNTIYAGEPGVGEDY
ncbi:ruvB [Symbiodinium microadriaticum]|nr:ruvB [Symbiodinium microadriaticum]